ncbi:hypothetical protein FSP39_006715 [Pinctada imbricata]|uniref:DEP domain-containing protein n=1 Tax=Pinctada imbricata TaxID=66713 RepID=A0AA89CAM4_PINIB|nr:hypothetical protein FSP39_006715 [Pinctada imbricata]
MAVNSTIPAINISGNTVPPPSVSIDNLTPAIAQCFVIILTGYLAGRLNLISSSQGKGIGTFVSTFSLPALLFKNMCILNFGQVDWYFLAGILIAKSAVFLFVATVTLVAKRPLNFGYAGLFGIFVTQSNDFALGYPILQALYEESHPEYLKYIYLIAPISIVFLNPIGFTMLEIQKRKTIIAEASSSSEGQRSTSMLSMGFHVIKGVITNPIVFMTLIGIVGNFIFKENIPYILSNILDVLGNAFSATALFYLGLSMVGKIQGQIGIGLIVPLLLIGVKALILPLVTWEIVSALEGLSGKNGTEPDAKSMFGFLYGTFPTAPSVFLYASHYSTAADFVAFGMVVGTFLSAPLMFVSAKMMTVVVVSELDYKSLLVETSFDTSIISIVSSVWVILILILSRRARSIPHQFLISLIFCHLLSCVGMVLYDGRESHKKSWIHYLQFSMILIGTLGARCWSAILAVTLYFLHCRSLCFVLRLKWILYITGFGIPVFCTGMLYLLGTHHMEDEIDPAFHYGTDQSLLSLFILLLCTIVIIVSLILKQRNHRDYVRVPTRNPTDEEDIEETFSDSQSLQRSGRKVKGQRHRAKISKCREKDSKNNHASTCVNCDQGCVGESIEDIVPYPTETENLLSDTNSSRSSSSDDVSQTENLETCTYGTCSREQRRKCAGLLRSYHSTTLSVQTEDTDEVMVQQPRRKSSDAYQTSRFIVLLVIQQFSMFVGLFLCMWRLFNKGVSGIYVEIQFLDTVFNYGQGFVILAVFGFDTKFIVMPFIKRWRRFVYGVEVIHLPNKSDLDDETIHVCDQFVKYHKEHCASQIVKDHSYHLREYKQVFTGIEMCDWLIEVGLAHDRGEAVAYGKTLLIGQIICHVTKEHNFHDMPYFYKFVDSEES